ncbi:MAG: histidine phosphatase family protein [Edaphocola sp.]
MRPGKIYLQAVTGQKRIFAGKGILTVTHSTIHLLPGKKIYFASDFHLGIPDMATSRERERLLCLWLDEISKDAGALYLVGDIFDVWFEYKNVIPKGFTRFLGKLAALADAGLHIEAFSGNHDLWMRDYFQDELNIPIHHHPLELEVNGKRFLIAHGDGLGPGDHGYKLLKSVLRNPMAQWLYRRLHPDTGVGVANYFSRLGPKHADTPEKEFLGEEKEWLMQYSRTMLAQKHYDYFIFGHRHIAITWPLATNSLYVNLGDWIRHNSYAEFDGEQLALKYYKPLSSSMPDYKTLVIIRHAKSDWSALGQTDYDRPLNQRGLNDAPEMGRRLKEQKLIPDLIVASAAQRTTTTAQLIAEAVGYDTGKIALLRKLYHSTPDTLEETVMAQRDDANTLYIVAHNPGVSYFATSCIPNLPMYDLPTCAVVAIKVATKSWANFAAAPKHLLYFDYPKNEQ